MKHPHRTTSFGFARASTLVQARVRTASEGRGFAQTRLLTHWAEIVGDDIAKTAQPVQVTYAKGGMGASLTLLTTGAMAPILEMQKEIIREKVNACYGYNAISRIRITQTAPVGFADGRVAFGHAEKVVVQPDASTLSDAKKAASGITNESLRDAIEALGANILTKNKQN